MACQRKDERRRGNQGPFRGKAKKKKIEWKNKRIIQ